MQSELNREENAEAVQKTVLAERMTFGSYYFYGGLLAAIGTGMAVFTALRGPWYFCFLCAIVILAGLFFIFVPLRQCGLPLELIAQEGGVFVVTDVKRRRWELHAGEIVEVNARRILSNEGMHYHGHRVHNPLNCGYVYIVTEAHGKIKVGYVHRPFDRAAALHEAAYKIRETQRTETESAAATDLQD